MLCLACQESHVGWLVELINPYPANVENMVSS